MPMNLAEGEQALQPREEEHVLGRFFADRPAGLAGAVPVQCEQDGGAEEEFGVLRLRQGIAAGMREHPGVLRRDGLAPLRHHAFERHRELLQEQSLAATGDIGMGVEDLLQPGRAGAGGRRP